MARVLPYPIDLAVVLDRLHSDPRIAPDTLASHHGDGYLPDVFDHSFYGFRTQSAYVARLDVCRSKADSSGGLVFEYAHQVSKGGRGLFGFTVAADEEELRNRLAVYYVMTS